MPAHRPLRAIKRPTDVVLRKLTPLFDEVYEKPTRHCIALEPRLKARVRMLLDRLRSGRLLREPRGYNLLWPCFLNCPFSQGSFDPGVFAKNYERLFSAEVARLFFAEVGALSPPHGWPRDELFRGEGP